MTDDRAAAVRAAVEAWNDRSQDRKAAWDRLHALGVVSAVQPGAPEPGPEQQTKFWWRNGHDE